MIEPKTTISIDGDFLPSFENISLNQAINKHHVFEIIVDYDTIEKQGTHTLEKSKNWLGKSIVINFDKKEFLGIITNIQLQHENGFNGKLVLSGYSTTILLDSGKHLHSWLEKDLSTIIKDTVEAAGVEATIAPVFKKTIEYQAQYNETHFQFVQRLAKQYNEWLYYDGVKLVFGKPQLEAAKEIEYGKDISSINIGIQAIASNQNLFSYNTLEDKKNEASTKDTVAGLNELGTFAFDSSKKLFKIKPNQYTSARAKDKSDIETLLKNKQSSVLATTNVMTATSRMQGLGVGSVIKVSSAMYKNKGFEEKNYGEYIIISINHQASGVDEYSNEFKAIAAGVTFLPEPAIQEPNAQPQMATVISNEDPKKKGRVQVQFQWQNGDQKSSWLRVMTPDAGKSDKVGTNRGFVHIPETGDQVMIGFRYNDPNRPFVMGSLFNGNTGGGGIDGNKIKSLTTRTGTTITFNDDEGQGNITISDPSGNVVVLNGDETITISAPKSITMNSKEITLNAEEKITLKGDKNVDINSNEISATAENKIALTSQANINVESVTKEEKHTKYNLEAQATVDINGTAMTNVKGGMVNLN